MFSVQLWKKLIIAFPLHQNSYYRSILEKVSLFIQAVAQQRKRVGGRAHQLDESPINTDRLTKLNFQILSSRHQLFFLYQLLFLPLTTVIFPLHNYRDSREFRRLKMGGGKIKNRNTPTSSALCGIYFLTSSSPHLHVLNRPIFVPVVP